MHESITIRATKPNRFMNMFIELIFHYHVNSITTMVWSSACSGAESKAATEAKASFIIVSGLYPALHAFNMACSKRSNPYVVPVMSSISMRPSVYMMIRSPINRYFGPASRSISLRRGGTGPAQRALLCRPQAGHYLKRRRLQTRFRMTTDRAHDQIA